MGQTWVTGVDRKSKDELVVTVALYGFEHGTQAHISGQLTQDSGAVAYFSDVKTVEPLEKTDLRPEAVDIATQSAGQLRQDEVLIQVTAKESKKGEAVHLDPETQITAVATASTMWLTILNATAGQAAASSAGTPQHTWKGDKKTVISF